MARAAADILTLALQLLLVSLLARQLGTFAYGLFSQFTATALILVPILVLRLNTACVRYFPAITTQPTTVRRRFLTLLGIVGATALGAGLLMAATRHSLARLVFADTTQADLILLLAGYCFLRVITLFAIDFFRAINKTRWSSLFTVVQGSLTLLAVLAALLMWRTDLRAILRACLAAEAILALILLATILLRFLPATTPAPQTSAPLAPYFRYSLPLVPYSLFVSLVQFGDRYFIAHLLDVRQAGIYALAYTLTGAAFLINAAIAYVIYPYLSELWTAAEYGQVKTLLEQGQNLFLYFAIPITAGLILLAPDLLVLLAGTDFLVGHFLILWIALGHLCLGIYSINSYLIDLSQRTGLFLAILLCAAGLNLALNALLIPRLGLSGAALATFAAYALQALLLWFVTKRLVGFRLTWHPSWLLRCLAAAGLMVLLLRLLPAPTALWHALSMILAGAFCYTGLTFLFMARDERRHLLALFAKGTA